MVNAQEWLDQNYPLNGTCIRKWGRESKWNHDDYGKKRSEIKKIEMRFEKLTGSLTLTGFNNLTELDLYGNKLTNLDVSSCRSLTKLECQSNQLTSLNASNCGSLTELDCHDNQLTTLNVNNCRNLTKLNCEKTQLTTLNVSSCTSLDWLNCDNNQLTSLNASNCTSLTNLYCDDNQLTSLNVSNCRNLTTLYCWGNQLTSLNASNCKSLTTLNCNDNKLTSLNISNCENLTELDCQNNKLTSLNVSNCGKLVYLYCGDNQLTTLTMFSKLVNLKRLGLANNSWTDNNLIPLQNLTNLTDLHIQNTNLTGLEYLPASLEKIWCTGNSKLEEQLKDYAKKNSKGEIDYYDYQAWKKDNIKAQEYLNEKYPKDQRNSVKKLNISSQKLTSSLEVSDFTNLRVLNCSSNNFTTLTINNQGYLKDLDCHANKFLTSLTITNNPSLTSLNCNGCQLTTLTLTNNGNLESLWGSNNQLQATKLNFLTKLTSESLVHLDIENNNLSGDLANLSQFTKLKTLNLRNNPFLISSLQPLQNLTNLQELRIENTNLTSLECLPESLETIYCTGKLAEQLKNYKKEGEEDGYNYQAWRKDKQPENKDKKPESEKPKDPKNNIKAQEYLANNYPHAQRKNITKIEIKEADWNIFAGELDFSDFTNLKEIAILAEKLPHNWANFYNWLNEEIVDINAKGYEKGNFKAAKRSEYPNLAGRDYDCLGYLMNSLENLLKKTLLDYTGKNLQNTHQEPLLVYDDNKSFFQLASGNSTSFKCGKTFELPRDQVILNEYEKLLREWKVATNAAKQVLTIKSIKNDSLPFTAEKLLTFRQKRLTDSVEDFAWDFFNGINISKEEISQAYKSEDYTTLLAKHLDSNDLNLEHDKILEKVLRAVATSLAVKKMMDKHPRVETNNLDDEEISAIIFTFRQLIMQLGNTDCRNYYPLYLEIINESTDKTDHLRNCQKAWELALMTRQTQARTQAPPPR